MRKRNTRTSGTGDWSVFARLEEEGVKEAWALLGRGRGGREEEAEEEATEGEKEERDWVLCRCLSLCEGACESCDDARVRWWLEVRLA